ncbi:MAG: sorbosone dehydrogenase family protein [Halobacteriaceae archaeon]
MPPTRRRLLGALAGAAGLAGCGTPLGGESATASDAPISDAGTTTAPPRDGFPARVGVDPLATGFAAPIAYETVPGEPGGFVADQIGLVHRVVEGTVADAPFLDLRDHIVSLRDAYDERGHLGLAFHPDFGSNRRLYVRYSAPRREGTPADYSHTFVLSEFRAREDGAGVVEGSERTLLELPEPQGNHNAGGLAFGPRGHLYVGTGDGGGGGDSGRGHAEDWYDALPGGNGQDVTENRLGSVLRIDVDDRTGDLPYGIPSDNPLVGRDGYDEQYAWGFRNPWRISVDGADVYVADVGQTRFEEVNTLVAGGNYGWNVREGRACYGASSCPSETPAGDPFRDPNVAYAHDADSGPSGQAVIGGHVARGDAAPALRELYVFADWNAEGRLFLADPSGGGQWPVRVAEMVSGDVRAPGSRVLGFGRDAAGDLYVCSTDRSGPSGSSGAVHRLVAP